MNYAYYALHKLNILPSQFADMPMREKAVVIAFIDLKIEAEKKEAAKQKLKRK